MGRAHGNSDAEQVGRRSDDGTPNLLLILRGRSEQGQETVSSHGDCWLDSGRRAWSRRSGDQSMLVSVGSEHRLWVQDRDDPNFEVTAVFVNGIAPDNAGSDIACRCGWCGAVKENPRGMCGACARFPRQLPGS